METKKNPSKDVHRLSGIFFQIGLCISIGLVITAFEWSTEYKKVVLRITDETFVELTTIPVTRNIEPTLPSPIKHEIPVKASSFTPVTEVSDNSSTPETNEPLTIDQSEISNGSQPFVFNDPETCDDCLVLFPEKKAEPVGGFQAFYKDLAANLKYPARARNHNAGGKVTVEFVVNKEGRPVDIKVVRGVGYGCDEEAIRVIGLSKWNPGLQRGRPVPVKMFLAITFQLN